MAAFKSYSWPGNIRELQNLIERAVILANDETLPNPLPRQDRGPPRLPLPALHTPETLSLLCQEHSESPNALLSSKTLDATGWVIGGENGAAAKARIEADDTD